MMKAEEVRIGNYVYRAHYGIYDEEVGVVNGFDLWHGAQKDGSVNHLVEWNAISPIPLTGKWLKKFGFTKTGKGVWYKDWKSWHYQIEKHPCTPVGYVFFIDVEGEAAPPSVEIGSVHELQNLYYALTGEELTIE
jgi:hypothetical protein